MRLESQNKISKLTDGLVGRGYEKWCSFANYDAYKNMKSMQLASEKFNISNPFFSMIKGIPGATVQCAGKTLINFSSYNYLNLNGDPRVIEAAKSAIDCYGTSVSASRLVAGERIIQQEFEEALAKFYGAEKSLLFVSGHATNVTTIGYLFGENDLILHDEYIHDSIRQGIKLSGAAHLTFKHNNWQQLDKLLTARRHEFQRVLVVIEGMYSMDGDYPELPKFIEIKKRHHAFLMVDEAHSLGVLGETGRGIAEFFDADPMDVDIWMGTLSKTLASCGGYIAGSAALVDHLKVAAPGFLYSVGISPPLVAASFEALNILINEPERVHDLNKNAKLFLTEAKKAGLDTGISEGYNIIPIICGSSRKAVELSNKLRENGVYVQPIIYPAVPEKQARLRFFISSAHAREQILEVVKIMTGLI